MPAATRRLHGPVSKLRKLEYKYVVAIVFVAGLFMDILDATIVNVAIPSLQTNFHTTQAGIEWVVTGYLLSLAVWIPASGWLGDRFGTKKIFLLALFLFTTASILCGAAWNIESLIAFRVLQGVGGGMLTPVGTAMLFRAFPPRERAAASGILTIPTVIAPATGPVLGGFLVDSVGWRWIFLVNVPVGVFAFIFGALFLEEHKEESAGSFDLAGFVLSGAGLASLLYALSQGPGAGWGSPEVLIPLVAGLVAFAVLIVVELRIDEPMLDLRLFGDRLFRSASVANFMSSASLFGLLFLLPLFLQPLWGLSAFQSGLATFPQAIGVILVARPVSKVYRRVGPRRLLAGGLAGISLTTALFYFVDLDTSLWWIRLIMFTRGLFFACAIISLQTASFATIAPKDTGRASSLFNTLRQVGSAFGVAALSTYLILRKDARGATDEALFGARSVVKAARQAAAAAPTPENLGALKQAAAELTRVTGSQVSAFHDAFLGAVVLSLAGAAVALLIRDSDAAATMLSSPAREPSAAH